MKTFLWFLGAAIVVVAAFVFDLGSWFQGGRALTAREGWLMVGVAGGYVAYLLHQSLRGGFGSVDLALRRLDRAVLDLRVRDAAMRAAIARAVGPREGETQQDVNERADVMFLRELELIDVGLAAKERARQAGLKEATTGSFKPT